MSPHHCTLNLGSEDCLDGYSPLLLTVNVDEPLFTVDSEHPDDNDPNANPGDDSDFHDSFENLIVFAIPGLGTPGNPGPLVQQGIKQILEKMAGKGTPGPFKAVESLVDCVTNFAKDDSKATQDPFHPGGVNPGLNFSKCMQNVLNSLQNPQ